EGEQPAQNRLRNQQPNVDLDDRIDKPQESEHLGDPGQRELGRDRNRRPGLSQAHASYDRAGPVRKRVLRCRGRRLTASYPITIVRAPPIRPRIEGYSTTHGAVAQLGERRVRNAKVRGSIPLGSTNAPAANYLNDV